MSLFLPENQALRPLAAHMRKNMTDEERHLWYDCLQKAPFRFSRQKVIGDFIVDFYCAKAALAVELDGSRHYEADGLARDAQRTAYLEGLGLQVLRFANHDIHDGFEAVKERIYEALLMRVRKYHWQKAKNIDLEKRPVYGF